MMVTQLCWIVTIVGKFAELKEIILESDPKLVKSVDISIIHMVPRFFGSLYCLWYQTDACCGYHLGSGQEGCCYRQGHQVGPESS